MGTENHTVADKKLTNQSLNFNFPQGNEALMELGIKTGLTLLFS
jgi:hypothetical protein